MTSLLSSCVRVMEVRVQATGGHIVCLFQGSIFAVRLSLGLMAHKMDVSERIQEIDQCFGMNT